MNSSMSPYLSMFLASAPLLIAYLVALTMALVYWSQHPLPSALVLAASIILLVTTIVQPIVQQQLFSMRTSNGWSTQQYAQWISLIGMGFSLFRAAAFGLMVWAVFAGRSEAMTPTGFQTLPPRIR